MINRNWAGMLIVAGLGLCLGACKAREGVSRVSDLPERTAKVAEAKIGDQIVYNFISDGGSFFGKIHSSVVSKRISNLVDSPDGRLVKFEGESSYSGPLANLYPFEFLSEAFMAPGGHTVKKGDFVYLYESGYSRESLRILQKPDYSGERTFRAGIVNLVMKDAVFIEVFYTNSNEFVGEDRIAMKGEDRDYYLLPLSDEDFIRGLSSSFGFKKVSYFGVHTFKRQGRRSGSSYDVQCLKEDQYVHAADRQQVYRRDHAHLARSYFCDYAAKRGRTDLSVFLYDDIGIQFPGDKKDGFDEQTKLLRYRYQNDDIGTEYGSVSYKIISKL